MPRLQPSGLEMVLSRLRDLGWDGEWDPKVCKQVCREWRDAFWEATGPVKAVKLKAAVQLGSDSPGPLLQALSAWAARHARSCAEFDVSIACLRGGRVDEEATLAAHEALWAARSSSSVASLELGVPGDVAHSLTSLVQRCVGLRRLRLNSMPPFMPFVLDLNQDQPWSRYPKGEGRLFATALVATLAALPQLQELQLQHAYLCMPLRAVLEAVPADTLTCLTLTGVAFEEGMPKSLVQLGQLTALQKLHLTGLDAGTYFVEGDVDAVIQELPAALSQLTRLTHLDLSGNHLLPLVTTGCLQPLIPLQHLDLSGCDLPRAASRSAFRALTALTYLSIYLFGAATYQLDLGGNPRLCHLELRAWPSIVELVPLGVLETLTALTALHLECEGVGAVGQPLRFPPSLRTCQLVDGRLEAWPEALSYCTALTHLEVYRNQVLRVLTTLQHVPRSLTSLVVACSDLKQLPGVQALAALTYLDLKENWVLGLDPALLAGLSQLRELHLPVTSAWAPGSTGLSELQSLTRLGMYGMSSTPLLSPLSRLEGLASLRLLGLHNVELTELPSGLGALTALDLSYSRVVPEGVLTLASLAGLRELNLSHCQMHALPAGLGGLTSLTSIVYCRCITGIDVPGSLVLELTAQDVTYLRDCFGVEGPPGDASWLPTVLYRKW